LNPCFVQGAARRLATQKKNLEIIESTGAAGKPDTNKVKKYFRLEVNRRRRRRRRRMKRGILIRIEFALYKSV